MSRILFFLRQLISGPASTFSGPFLFFRDVYARSTRGKAFILALPALFMIFFGSALLLASQLGRESRLVQRYDELAKKSSQQVEALMSDYAKTLRLYQLERMKNNEPNVAGAANTEITAETFGDETEPGQSDPELMTAVEKNFRKSYAQIRELRTAEKLYLQKLIELSPNDSSYKFRYALAHRPLNPEVVVELIRDMAPIEEDGKAAKGIGNSEAHLWMARHYYSQPTTDKREAQFAAMMIEKHASKCLIVDATNREARELRGHVLQLVGEYARAYDDFSALFDMDPRYFIRLVQINVLMDRQFRNTEVLDNAARRLQQELGPSRDDVAKWETTWEMYADCMMRRKRFNQLRQELELERDAFAGDELKRNFLNSILGNAYSSRVSELQPTVATNSVDADESIRILESAASSGVMNEVLKYNCALLGRNVSSLTERAKAVYDCEKDSNPPGMVLADLAIDALQKQEYARAINILERARAKLPGNAVILNNLAFAYLSAESSSPAKALDLIDQAIRSIGSSQIPKDEASRFRHTRGVALMQLNRIDEAKDSFLEALKGRPENESILEALIRCEEGRDDKMKQIYVDELQRVRDKAKPVGGDNK